MKAIVTKYVVTSGIEIVDGDVTEKMLMVGEEGEYRRYFHGNDWHDNSKDALKDVRERFAKRAKSLLKALDGLEAKKAKALKQIENLKESGIVC